MSSKNQKVLTNSNNVVYKKKRHPVKMTLKVIGTILLVFGITIGLMACFATVYIRDNILPNTTIVLSSYSTDLTTYMYYTDSETGEYKELSAFHGSENRSWISISEMPENLTNAAVAIEDQRFYQHHGVDWKRTFGGLFYLLTGQDVQGGSTITQQLIKNVTDEDEVTVKRKITEIFRALELEKNYSKETILENYLNYIYLGSGCYGVEAASKYYFGKSASELDLAECASLVSITNNPSLYNPEYNPENNKNRQELVLDKMLELGFIDQAEYDEAYNEELNFVFDSTMGNNTDHVYSWFEEQVIDDVINDLMDTYGYSEEKATDLFYSGGLSIYTTIDPTIQEKVEAIYEDQSNLDYVSSTGQELQSAITVIDNETGDIVALVGSMGEKTENRIWNMATDSNRQPGSAIKPLSVYSIAIENNQMTPYSIIDDYPYTKLNDSAWPVNSQGYYSGLTTMQDAVAMSLNTVAVRVLGDTVGITNSFNWLTDKFHISTLVKSYTSSDGTEYNDYGLAQLALGGLTNGVNTREMAAAYTTFANNGEYRTARTYTQVLDSDGNVILNNEQETETVLSEASNYYMTEMLENVVTNGTASNAAVDGQATAGKTGTTSENFDRWFCGYTPYYTAAIWTGYTNSESMEMGENPAASMFSLVMNSIHEGYEYKDFDEPDNLVSCSICLDCGKLASEECANDVRGSRVLTADFVDGTQPTEYCTCHETIKLCTETNMVATEYCPTTKEVTAPNYIRDVIDNVTATDSSSLYSAIISSGNCTTHTKEWFESQITVPSFIGMDLTEVEKNITELGLEIGTITTEENAQYKANTVISQSVAEGTKVSSGTKIDLVVSSGSTTDNGSSSSSSSSTTESTTSSSG